MEIKEWEFLLVILTVENVNILSIENNTSKWMRCKKSFSNNMRNWINFNTSNNLNDRKYIWWQKCHFMYFFFISEWETVIFKLLSVFYVYSSLFKFIKNKFKHSLHVTDAWCKFFNVWGLVFISVFVILSNKFNQSDWFICYYCFFWIWLS